MHILLYYLRVNKESPYLIRKSILFSVTSPLKLNHLVNESPIKLKISCIELLHQKSLFKSIEIGEYCPTATWSQVVGNTRFEFLSFVERFGLVGEVVEVLCDACASWVVVGVDAYLYFVDPLEKCLVHHAFHELHSYLLTHTHNYIYTNIQIHSSITRSK